MNKDLSQEIIYLFSTIHRVLKQRMSVAQPELQNLTLLQWQAVVWIKRQDSVTMSDLAQQLQISGAAATMLVDRLVDMNLLVRNRDDKDRRIVYLGLSPEIDQSFNLLLNKKQSMISEMLEGLDDQEAADLRRILQKIVNTIQPIEKEEEDL